MSPTLTRFIEHYKTAKGYKSRSEVISVALNLLQEKELEKAYKQADSEIDQDWDGTIGDGLSNL
ncbi:MAG TPA: CopG family transcriptional regulator [Cyanothece sp. UBA12306]|nr:CopG family transcriptional regulator [Cyanothece sp. UBA12306]